MIYSLISCVFPFSEYFPPQIESFQETNYPISSEFWIFWFALVIENSLISKRGPSCCLVFSD
jgi:hypothetical protein